MRYIIMIGNDGRYSPADRARLIAMRRLHAELAGLNDVRVAADHIEFDLFLSGSSPDGAAGVLSGVGPVIERRRLPSARTPHFPIRNPQSAFAGARDLFNAGRFWECHEEIEGLWRTAVGDEKALLRGLILTAAAFVHFQRDEADTALRMLERALPLLHWRGRQYCGVDMEVLRRKVGGMVESGRMAPFRI